MHPHRGATMAGPSSLMAATIPGPGSGSARPIRGWSNRCAIGTRPSRPRALWVYSGALWPEWRGHIFTGSLNSDLISRLDPANGFAEARIATEDTIRVRDIREAPDESIWFLSVYHGAVYRMTAKP